MPTPSQHSSADNAWIAIAGNPNTGKTSLFNAITGLRQKVGNYPGVTVERRQGAVRLPSGRRAECIDVPGCYSLVARSQDEQIAHDVLMGQVEGTPPPDLVLVVVDASNLERNLYLASQIIDMDIPSIVVLNMIDVAERSGIDIDTKRLSRELGVPVAATVAVREEGVAELLGLIESVLDGRLAGTRVGGLDGHAARAGRDREAGRRGASDPPSPGQGQAAIARPWKTAEEVERRIAELAAELQRHNVRSERADAEAIWLLSSVRERDELVGINPHIREQVNRIQQELEAAGTPFRTCEIQARYAWIERAVERSVRRRLPARANWSDRLDLLFTHRIAGPALFLLAMAVIFQAIFAWADPAITAIEQAFAALSSGVRAVLPPGPLRDLLTEGVIAGAGNVVVFLPQILILFFAINLLEDTGYMARAAYMMDRVMGRVGLHGRAFIPLLSSFACAIPGIMATRTIENRRDRLVTILVAPLMSCSARLPVYAMVIAALFDADRPVVGFFTVGGLILLTLYLFSVVAAITMAFVLKATILRGPRPPLVLEMPPYRLPRLGSVLRNMAERAGLFLRRAGTVIVAATIILWALLSYPRGLTLDRDFAGERAAIEQTAFDAAARARALATLEKEEAAARVRASYGGRLGRAIEPLIAPLGFDWKLGIGLIGAFSAREVLVSTLGVVYGVGGEATGEDASLRKKLRDDRRADGRPVYTPLVGLSLMIYFVLACQCVSTLAVVRRETNGWRWPAFMLGYMTALAWIASFVVYQGGRWMGYS